MKRYLPALLYSIFLISFTVYILLDTFVIARVYQVIPNKTTGYVSDQSGPGTNSDPVQNGEIPPAGTSELIQTKNYYSDGNISIILTEHRQNNTTVYVADVKLSSAAYLKTAFADNSYGKNVTAKTSVTAQKNNAILAINGDFYGARETGYVLRNSVLYRDIPSEDQEALVIYKNGSFEVITETRTAAANLLEQGAAQILSFGPALVLDASIAVTKDEEVGKAMSSNPRTAIGIVGELHYLFVVSDGRTEESEGLSLRELAEFMTTLGVHTAYNLDGGGSSTMYFNGEVINNPTTNGKTIKERSVSDIVYIGY